VKVREAGRIVAVIIAVAINTDSRREVLGLAVGPSEAKPFWTKFLRSLTRRGLRGVKLVSSDAHEGLKAAAKTKCPHWKRINAGRHKMFAGPRKPELTEAQKMPAKKREALARVLERRRAPGLRPGMARAAQAGLLSSRKLLN